MHAVIVPRRSCLTDCIFCQANKFIHSFIHLSCSSALFVLSQTVDYFVQHGSNVFMAALDARKAFNRINHVKLFEKLIER